MMNMSEMSFIDWQRQFHSENACLDYLKMQRWPDGFICPKCGHRQAYQIHTRELYECCQCHKQTSVTSDTLFHGTHIPLSKWFTAIYFIGSDKGGISALRLKKLIEVNWRTARLILKKLRIAMGHRDRLYWLSGNIELDDCLVGGKQKGKRGRGAAGKTPIIVAVETQGERAGYIAMQAVNRISHQSVEQFVQAHILPNQYVRSDGLRALTIIDKTQHHEARVTPKELVDEWLPWVHIAISNLKTFIQGTFHGISKKYVQEYLNEFIYRFNRRRIEKQIPMRLLNIAIFHSPMNSC
ncbi:IS1595 family transposase [Shewanella sp. NFH-SH190041]|nr:IS1595 family transposase [Shewanella sp. NFH-SH190041]BDM63664.1 IS1595 family transposase [Shewanella sp. NFH-SH190041]BDM63903.1 IS1595 family transposase [Shewanella sp. NFH-SH190041]BDM63939.1 IS1595 family transposase [Shewanella sp. NFH-SH190041]BDM64627.1 IS1595 family transposase [Shewanella sp. NFH-SH190041]